MARPETWEDYAKAYVTRFSGAQRTAVNGALNEWLVWTDEAQVAAKDITPENAPKTLEAFSSSLELAYKRGNQWLKKGAQAREVAGEMLQAALGKADWFRAAVAGAEDLVEKAAQHAAQQAAQEVAEVPPTPTEDEDMAARREEEQEQEQGQEQELDETESDEAEDVEEEVESEPEPEPQPKQRKRAVRPQPIYVQMKPVAAVAQPRAPKAQVRSSKLDTIMGRTLKVRIYMRNELGKREHVEDFPIEDFGNMTLEAFIKEYVDPRVGDPQADFSEYIAYELDPRTEQERQPPSVFRIEHDVQEQAPRQPDPFAQVRGALGLVQELQQTAQPQHAQQRNPIMESALKDAASKGDTGNLMMLMMMDQMMSRQAAPAQSTRALELILERMDRIERRNQPQPEAQLPPWAMMPPPSTPSQDNSHLNKVLELAMAKFVQPPPSVVDQIREMAAMQKLVAPPTESPAEAAMRAELVALRAKLDAVLAANAAPAQRSSGIEDSLANFEKFTTIVKSVAPQVGGTGLSGFIQGLLTPETGKMLAGVLAAPAQAAVKSPVVPAAQQTVPGQVQPPQPPVPQAQPAAAPPPPPGSQPPNPPPPNVVQAAKAFGIAQTVEHQAERFVDVLLAMYMSNDPYYQKLLSPSLEALNGVSDDPASLNVPRKMAFSLLAELRPQVASPEMVDRVLAVMAKRAGASLPPALVASAGAWTLDFRGEVLLPSAGMPQPVAVNSPPQGAAPVPQTVPAAASVVTVEAKAQPAPVVEPVLATPDAPAVEPVKTAEQLAKEAADILARKKELEEELAALKAAKAQAAVQSLSPGGGAPQAMMDTAVA